MRYRITLLDRLAWLAVGVGATMAASGAFTLAFQASGIGFIGQSVMALVLGSALTAAGFRLAARARDLEGDLRPRRRPGRVPVRFATAQPALALPVASGRSNSPKALPPPR